MSEVDNASVSVEQREADAKRDEAALAEAGDSSSPGYDEACVLLTCCVWVDGWRCIRSVNAVGLQKVDRILDLAINAPWSKPVEKKGVQTYFLKTEVLS